ncbi:MAG: GNAT family N-acetyltransferase [Deltaproteobacteria bacterium]|nr:GNAT family N-acetyltransferase [Deltaproteobacteria bacterium]
MDSVFLEALEKDQRAGRLAELMDIWEASVRASHTFLPSGEVARLKPWVESAILGVPNLVIARVGAPVAFMGIKERKLEMLFVHPVFFRRGIGRKLVDYARGRYAVDSVDCNEQNPQALAFYRSMGFTVVGRTETDEMGNPYPIVKLRIA